MKNLTLIEVINISGGEHTAPYAANVIGGAATGAAIWGTVGMMSGGPPGAMVGAATGAFNGAVIVEGSKALHDTVHD
jgi:hypothetical protein